MLIDRLSIAVATLLLLLTHHDGVSAVPSPVSDFMADNLRSPNEISTDPTYDKQCIIPSTNAISNFQVAINRKVTLGSHYSSFGPFWALDSIASTGYTVNSRKELNCTKSPATIQNAGLAALGPTLPTGVAVLGQVFVRSTLTGSVTANSVFFADPYCTYQGIDYTTHTGYYSEIRTQMYAIFAPISPELLLDASGKVSVIKPKTSAYYLMKFQGCSETSCQVNDPNVDSVADSILFGKTPWNGPVNSQYPTDGVVVFMVHVIGTALTLTGGRLSAGIQPCRAIWYFVKTDPLTGIQPTIFSSPWTLNRQTSDYLAGTVIAPDATIVDSSTAAFAGKLLGFSYSWDNIDEGTDILDFAAVGDICDYSNACYPPSNYTLPAYTPTTKTITSTTSSIVVTQTAYQTITVQFTSTRTAGISTAVTLLTVPLTVTSTKTIPSTTKTTTYSVIEKTIISSTTTTAYDPTYTTATLTTTTTSTSTSIEPTTTTFIQTNVKTKLLNFYEVITLTITDLTSTTTTTTATTATSTVLGDQTVTMCNSRECTGDEIGDYTATLCGSTACEATGGNTGKHTFTMCGTASCTSAQQPSATITMCGTSECPITMCGTSICGPTESGYFTLPMCNGAPCDSTSHHSVSVCGSTRCSEGELPSETLIYCGTTECPITMCGTAICDPTESGDFTLAMCNDAPCDSTTVHTVTVCGKTKCSSGEVPSETFTLCGTELCPVDPNNTDDRSGSKTNNIIVTLPSFIPSATVDVTVTDSVDSSSDSSTSSTSLGVNSSSRINLNSDRDSNSDTSNNPIEESSDSLNTPTSGESNTNSDGASNSESNSSSNSDDVISDSISDGSSAVRSIGSQSVSSTSDVEICVGVDCPTSITMCGTSICSPGETNGDFIVTMCGQRPCGNGGLHTVTICPDNSVCSDEGGQIYTMCGTGICPEPPVFTTIAPFWWHHHDHHHRSHTSFENTEHYHQVHGDRIFPWTEGVNVDWINWDTTTTST